MLSQDRLARLRAAQSQIGVREAMARLAAGACLVDIREAAEMTEGSPAGAVRITRSFLELQIERHVADSSAEVMLMCESGVRSLFAADDLTRMGFTAVHSVEGGFRAWREAGLPVQRLRPLTPAEQERYARHLMIPEVGPEGQTRLLSSKVALVGAGGLGSPLAYYLAAAGVGTLGLIDNDRLERSNLQRQILHADDRVGELKIASAAKTLTAFNPDIALNLHELRLTAENAAEVLAGYDLVIDGSDNIATRYAVSDASTRLGIPMIYGAIFRFEGQVSAFWPSGPAGGPCYRCLFPEPPPKALAPACAEAGVLGVLPGVIGTIMATEALKILLGVGRPLTGRMLTYSALDGAFQELTIDADPDCAWCQAQIDQRATA